MKIIDVRGSQHLTSLPDLSRAPSLEILDLSYCRRLTEIPSYIQHLFRLHSMHLSNCENLLSVPDCNDLKNLKLIVIVGCYKLKVLPKLPNNVEQLYFGETTNFYEISSSYYKYLNEVKYLYFDGYKSLTSIPDYSGLKSLTQLTVIACPKVKTLPEFPNNIEELELMDIPIEELPSSLENLCRLRYLDLSDCSRLKSLPSSVCKWKPLRTLRLTNCSKINKLPDDIGTLEYLEEVKAAGTVITEVPSSFSCLTSLDSLSFSRREVFPSLLGLDNLHTLSLSDCGIIEVPDSLGCLTSLEHLYLDKNNFEKISESIINLSKLRYLNISYCERLRVLPKLPWANITAVNCTSLEEISCPSFHNDMFALDGDEIMVSNFINCFKLNQNSLNNFMKSTLLELQGQAAKRFYHQVYEGFPPPITIRYPDREIPMWFEYQSRGSSIDVDLPPNWFNYNFLCFAVCIVVAIPDRQSIHHGETFYVGCECNEKSKDGDQPDVINNRTNWEHLSQFWVPNSETGYLRSNHVDIRFGFHIFRELYGNQLSFQFYLKDRYSYCQPEEGFNIDNYKVEKCGVHLMYGHHLEILDEKEEDELHFEESNEDEEPHLVESDEEDEPHPKRFKRIG